MTNFIFKTGLISFWSLTLFLCLNITDSNAQNIRTLSPNLDCPSKSLTPDFSWSPLKKSRMGELKYQLILVEVKEKQNVKEAIFDNPKIINVNDITGNGLKFPYKSKPLSPNRVYAYQVTAYVVVRGTAQRVTQSDIALFYTLDEKLPEVFQKLLCCEDNLVENEKWTISYGSPSIQMKEMGCMNSQGTIQMKGNKQHGDAVYQQLNSSDMIKEGQYYQLSFCAKAINRAANYCRFRVIAFNGNLQTTGLHPETSPDIAVIGESGNIKATDWTRQFLGAWKAPKDFERLAILLINDEDDSQKIISTGQISNVCLQKTDDCSRTTNDLGLTVNGNIHPDVEEYIKKTTTPETIDVNYEVGKLVDIFGPPFDANGESNWYSDTDCVAIGGEIPEEAIDERNKYDTLTLPGDISPEKFQNGLQGVYEILGKGWKYPAWGTIPEEEENNCRWEEDKSKPFGGRDIIYVHGLQLGHIMQKTIYNDTVGRLSDISRLVNYPNQNRIDSSGKSWPIDRTAFFDGGYYHNAAESYFSEHIEEFLGSVDNPSNRYMVVAFNCSQRLIENVHAAFTQISLAMNEGTGVVYGEDKRGGDCFGKEVVIISHSTGALLMNVAFGIARISGHDSDVRKAFGDIQYIAERAKAHVSLHGAIAGSELAGLAVVGTNVAAAGAIGLDIAVDMGIAIDNEIDPWRAVIIDALTGLNTADNSNTDSLKDFLDALTDDFSASMENLSGTFNESILVDLTPTVAKLLWGDYIQKNGVPVLTVAGGYPGSFGKSILTKWILPGFDDGVVSATSQSGSNALIFSELYLNHPVYSGILPISSVYDCGIDIRRGAPYFAEQFKVPLTALTGVAAYGSTPFLSPTGMVQPVLTYIAPSPRYPNHYPFLQSASDHMHSINDDDTPFLDYSSTFGAPNTEESLVFENNFLLENEIVNSGITYLVTRDVRRQDLFIQFSLLIPVINFFPPSFTMQQVDFSYTIPIWIRTYDTLNGNRDETTYVYEYVLR